MSAPDFTVVGAGLGGALMAIDLVRSGRSAEILERRADPRAAGAPAGRSINLALSTRGLHALGLAGLTEQVMEIALPMRARIMHSPRGSLTVQPYGTDAHHVIHSVSRAGLNQLLVEAAEAQGVPVRFEHRCSGIDPDGGSLRISTPEGEREHPAQAVIGADGAYSVIRRRLQRSPRFDYQQAFLPHGYKELAIPPTSSGDFALDPGGLHIWPRGGYMMIALPNSDRSFTCTLFWPYEGPDGFDAVQTAAAVEQRFQRSFPDVIPLIPDLAEQYFTNPTSSLVTIRCRPWHHGSRFVLLGDACHAVVPFYGQGANAAFEDCTVLTGCLARFPDRLEEAFVAYETARRPHTDVLADLALQNFVEMRDHTASRVFLARKGLERALHRVFPRWFIPLYTMVTFSRIPYGDAVMRSRRQWVTVAGAALAVLAAGALLGLFFLLMLVAVVG